MTNFIWINLKWANGVIHVVLIVYQKPFFKKGKILQTLLSETDKFKSVHRVL